MPSGDQLPDAQPPERRPPEGGPPPRSATLIVYGGGLLLGSVYTAVSLPNLPDNFQLLAGALVVALGFTGGAILARWPNAPWLYLSVAVFFLVFAITMSGGSPWRVLPALVALPGYWVLKGELRKGAPPNATRSS